MRTLRILSAMLVAGLLLTTVAALPAAAGTRVTAGMPPIRPRSAFTLTVTAKGHWRGTAVDYVRTFPNSCVLSRQTGAVFAF